MSKSNIKENNIPVLETLDKHSFVWLLLGLVLTTFSYGAFNVGICAWIFAIPLLRYINIRTKWSSILLMLLGMVIVANITFFHLVEDGFNVMNYVFCTLNGIRMWFPFLIYFFCRKLNTNKLIAYFAFPASVVIAEFFVDNPFVGIITSLSVSQFWNLGLMQIAGITGVVGVSFIVTLLASVINYVLEIGVRKSTLSIVVFYSVFVIAVTGVGMANVNNVKISTLDKTARVATSVDDMGIHIKEYSDNLDAFYNKSIEIISNRAYEAACNGSLILVFPEDAFYSTDEYNDKFLTDTEKIAKENNINILLPLLRLREEEKSINTLNFISREGKLLNTYTKNNLVPVVEEPTTERGDGKTPVIDIDGIKITYLICADFTSNKLAYNGGEADVFLNPSYDWEIFQYFTSYAVQARAIECGFATLRNPVNGNIVLYDCNGRPIHMSNAMNVHEGMLYIDVPCNGRQTIYETIGNVFPLACVAFTVFALISGLFITIRKKNKAA